MRGDGIGDITVYNPYMRDMQKQSLDWRFESTRAIGKVAQKTDDKAQIDVVSGQQ
jgi:hypothetical protein